MRKIKKFTRFGRLVLLTLAACLALLPAAAFAAIGIGTGANITTSNPVYFGRYPQSFSTNSGVDKPSGTSGEDYIQAADVKNGSVKYYLRDPIQWRVLQNDSIGNKLFLLSEKNLDGGIPYHEELELVTWETCTIRSWLNGYNGTNHTGSSGKDYSPDGENFISRAFAANEQEAIALTEVANPNNPTYNTDGGGDTNDKIFFLSIQEAGNSSFPAGDSARRALNTDYTATRNSVMYDTDDPGLWWLRSPGSVRNAVIVRDGGSVNINGLTVNYPRLAARPAFFLDLSSVLFTSAAAGGKSSATVGSGLVGASAPAGDIKLTVLDSSQTLKVTATTAQSTQSGETLTFGYTNAKAGTNQYVSCVLVNNSDGKITHYGKLADSSESASGTLTIPMPTGVADGTYTLKIFSEEANGDKLTDFCSTPVTMTVEVSNKEGTVSNFSGTILTDNSAPTLSSASATGVTAAAATLNFTSDEAGTYYYLVYTAAESAPDAATVKAQVIGTAVAKETAAATTGENTINVSGLLASTAYKAYVIVEDAAGNLSAVEMIPFTTTAAPVTPPGGGGSGGSGGGTQPQPSNSTTPTEISVTLNGTKIAAHKQVDGTYLVTVPAGTDITALPVVISFPSGTVSPASGSPQDFSDGPVTYTLTAQNGTTAKITVAVKIAAPLPTEKNYFSGLTSDCEIAYVQNADGTITAYLRIPFLPGSDPALIDAIMAAITGFNTANISYAYVDANGNITPIQARTSISAKVTAPYLEIKFTVLDTPSLDALKKGALEKITYWLKGDAAEYAQTFSGTDDGLAFSNITFTDETPVIPVEPSGGSSSGGCDAGLAGIGALVLFAGIIATRQTRKDNLL
jgi:hypothetical protein